VLIRIEIERKVIQEGLFGYEGVFVGLFGFMF